MTEQRRIIIFDLEFTTWDGAMQRDWLGQTPDGTDEYREITQIGAIKVDWPSGTVVDTFDQLVKPSVNPHVSDYFTNLTGITQEDIDQRGVDFFTALKNFEAFVGDDGPLYSYGNDIAVIGENIVINRSHSTKIAIGGYNFAAVGINYFINHAAADTRRVNSGGLAKHFGLAHLIPSGAEHNALYDCYSILVALQHLRERGAFLPM